MPKLDNRETTVLFDYTAGTANFYTTDKKLWQRLVKRNPRFLSSTDLMPGYELEYPLDECRDIAQLLVKNSLPENPVESVEK